MLGDTARHRALMIHAEDFTLMSPFGGEPARGGNYTNKRCDEIGRFFRNGSESSLEFVQAYTSGDVAVLAAIERTHVEVGGVAAQPWALRVTMVFRKDMAQWRLAYRYADPLAPGITLEQAASLARGSHFKA
jgi:ketosteroid isomerase-like protein